MKIRVNASKPYDVIVERGAKNEIAEYLKALGLKGKVAVVSDSQVAPLYSEEICDLLVYGGFEPSEFVFEAGEESKNLTVWSALLSFLADEELTRTDTVLALGGGVTGDMAGFAAAAYMRGVHFVNVPTTLLAAIDSSVGGKTAVDLPQGKNLVGAFYQPDLVLIDPDFFSSLPYEEIKNGLGEGVKYAVLEGGRIFEILSEGLTRETLEEFICLSVEAKKRIVEADEKESGARKFLNLGHTLAHAVEKESNYSVPHGIAVAYGVGEMARLSYKKGELEKEDLDAILALLEKCDLSLALHPVGELIAHFSADKKRAGDKLTLVTIRGIGDCRLTEIPLEEAAAYFEVE